MNKKDIASISSAYGKVPKAPYAKVQEDKEKAAKQNQAKLAQQPPKKK